MTVATGTLDLSHKAKVYLAFCFLLSTLATSGINGVVNVHFGAVQADQATRKADVRKVEDQVAEFDQLVRLYMTTLNAGEVSAVRREAVLNNAQAQYDFLHTLMPLVAVDERPAIEAYRTRLVELSSALRNSKDVPSTGAFAQSVAHAIDDRGTAIAALKRSVGMPAEG